MDDVVQSLGLGLVLGLVLISVLIAFPGEPFDYDINKVSNNGDLKTCGTHETHADAGIGPDGGGVFRRTPSSPACAHPASTNDAAKVLESSPVSTLSKSNPPATQQTTEKDLQKAKICKLQTLLGLEKHKMDELVARAQANDAEPGSSSSFASTSFAATSTYGGYLDFAFYFVILAALVYVLKSEYGINVFHLVAYLFPREVETASQVFSTPLQFFQQLTSATP